MHSASMHKMMQKFGVKLRKPRNLCLLVHSSVFIQRCRNSLTINLVKAMRAFVGYT